MTAFSHTRSSRSAPRRRIRRAVGAVVGAGLLYAGLAGAAWGTTPTATAQFGYTGSEQTFTVPAGVTQIQVTAVGGEGAPNPVGVAGGFGASVTAQLSVSPGQTLYLEVGGNGSQGGFNGGGAAGTGGTGGFSPNGDGGMGGGASDVRTVSASTPGSIASRVIVAGGGGGGGGNGGGNGGVGDGPGQGGAAAGIDGGGAGTVAAGGASGAGAYGGGSGSAGVLGSGGAGGSASTYAGGGGGGGGYYGGGGGGAGNASPPGLGTGTGGGGGGGASFVTAGASSVLSTDSTGTPQITITYDLPTSDVSTASIAFAGTQPQDTVSTPMPLTVTNNGSAPLVISGLTFSGANADDFFIGSNGCLGSLAPGASCQLTVRFAPQAAGARSATLSIVSNAGASPAQVALSATGGSLPQGPAGPSGAEGATGAAGAAGASTVVHACRALAHHGAFRLACRLAGTTVASVHRTHATLVGHGAIVRLPARLWGHRVAIDPGATKLVSGVYTLIVRTIGATVIEQVRIA